MWASFQRNSRWNDQESMGECKVLHPDMMKWLGNDNDRPSDEVLWGYKKGTYQFKDLMAYLEQCEKKKRKGKGKEEKSEGSSKKKDKLKKDKLNLRV